MNQLSWQTVNVSKSGPALQKAVAGFEEAKDNIGKVIEAGLKKRKALPEGHTVKVSFKWNKLSYAVAPISGEGTSDGETF